jgi:murein DD-endopeptidase MepM/ murein hydrolase activator NlpD
MKNTKIIAKISIVIPLLAAFFINSAVLLADSQQDTQTQQDAAWLNADTQAVSSQSTQGDSQQIYDRASKRVQFLENIREEIRAQQIDFHDITGNIKDVGQHLDEVQGQAKTLTEQLNALDLQISQTEDMIANVSIQITEKENELVLLYEDMDVKKAAVENQKRMLQEYLATLYEQESGISDTTADDYDVNIAKLLLSNETAGEQLQEIRYFSILENTGLDIFNKLELLLTDLQNEEQLLQDNKDKLTALNDRLSEEKNNLDVQKEAKANLLNETKGEENIYQQLLNESVQQQAQAQEDLDTLRNNLTFIQEKIAELGDNFNPDDYKSLTGVNKSSVYEYINTNKNATDDFIPRWPVSPSRGITAYFHDASYRAVFGVTHNAIDIRTPQGTIVRAPADGIVYKVRDNGFGYSYLILAHKGGFMSVYGHISEFKVKEGEKVFSGQPVALSGGTPGSKGAGLMTTGAHLHFELMKGGKYVDPLDYLPLSFLPIDTIPEKYKSRITGDKAKVKRDIENPAYASDISLTQMIERNALLESLAVQTQQ